ncbi:MAG: XdhC family protein [Vulcanimicrobiaceae bacterium]
MTIFERLAGAIRADRPVALVTRLDDGRTGAKLLIDDAGELGSLGSTALDRAVAAEARALLDSGGTMLRTLGADGEPVGDEVRVFIQCWAPQPDMYIFGAIDFSRAMTHVGKYLGFRVTVIDARPIFATKARMPEADAIVVAWPDEFLAGARISPSTALVILTHDLKFDVPVLQLALRSQAGYIGALGSRRTHATRLAALRAAGFGERELSRISAPIGLDIGARTPEETAISIAAEIVALRRGRSGARLRDGTLPVRGPAQRTV